MLLRTANRIFRTAALRRLISTPTAEHQTDVDAHYRRQRAARTDFLDEFGIRGGVKGERVLDLGCGLGTKTLAVARAGAKDVAGVDIDAEKVRRADEAARESDVSSVHFAVQDGSNLGFSASCFDVILLIDVVEHLPNPAPVLAECARVLCEGGRLLISFPPYRSPWGGHLFTHVPIPWVHLLFPDEQVLTLWRESHAAAVAAGVVRCSASRARAIIEADRTAALWDCNGMTIARFLDLVERAPFTVEAIRFKTLGKLGGSVKSHPRLREYTVTRLTAVLVA